jgi:hypothetical protein
MSKSVDWMPGIQIMKAFLQQAAVRGARSTVINPIGWLIATILAGLTGLLYLNAPAWLVILLGVFLALSITTSILSYVYFAIKSPDSLRSERFTLSKMVIEKSLKGDDLTGLIDPSLQMSSNLLPNTPDEPTVESHEQ